MKRKLVSILLTAVICLSFIPMTSVETEAADIIQDFTSEVASVNNRTLPKKAVMAGVSGVKSPVEKEFMYKDRSYTYYEPSDYIILGRSERHATDKNIIWRVLDSEKTSDGKPGMFLMSEYILGSSYLFTEPGQEWEDSEAKRWCDNLQGQWYNGENEIISYTTKTEKQGDAFGFWTAENTITNAAIHYPSAKEIHTYVSAYDRGPGLAAKEFNGNYRGWYTRTLKSAQKDEALMVQTDGLVNGAWSVRNTLGCRPVVNIKTDDIVFTKAFTGSAAFTSFGPTADYDGKEWRMAVHYPDMGTLKISMQENGDFLYSCDYLTADTFLSAIVMDNRTGAVTHYGNLAEIFNGTSPQKALAHIDIENINLADKSVYVFLEESAPDKTLSYVGDFVKLEFPRPEGSVELSEANFPDPAFRNAISGTANDKDGILTPEEIAQIKNVSCANLGIHNMKGVEYLTELTSLNCDGNPITELDVSQNSKLTKISCSNTNVLSLNLYNMVQSGEISVSAEGNSRTAVNGSPLKNLDNNFDMGKVVPGSVQGGEFRGGKLYFADGSSQIKYDYTAGSNLSVSFTVTRQQEASLDEVISGEIMVNSPEASTLIICLYDENGKMTGMRTEVIPAETGGRLITLEKGSKAFLVNNAGGAMCTPAAK